MPWYVFCPNDAFPNDVCNPNNYILVDEFLINCPNPSRHLCTIQASDNAGLPIITCALICEIANALNNNFESTNVLLRPDLFC